MANDSSTHKFKFSVIMSVYNTDKWLKEAVDSVINQNIGFKDNIQIIFINDGSTDKSEDICLRYQKRYPKNIVYKKQKNHGPAYARNVGLDLAEGKYVNFLDSDDLLSHDACSKVYDFFEKHYAEIDLVAIKMEFFEARTGPHMLNYKFKKDAVIDLERQFNYPQLSAASAFFKFDAIGSLRLDTELSIAEDAKFLTELLCQKLKYGVLAEPIYHYRRRREGSSLMNNRSQGDYWYTTVINTFHTYLIELSIKKFGNVLKFIQFLILYDLQGPLMADKPEVLTNPQFATYKKSMYNLLSYMDDDVILLQRKLNREYKYYLLGNKYNESVVKAAKRIGLKYYYKDHKIYDYETAEPKIYIEGLSNSDGTTHIQGRFTGFLFNGVNLELFVNNIKLNIKHTFNREKSAYLLGDFVHGKNFFEANVESLKSTIELYAHINVAGEKISLPVVYSGQILNASNEEAGVYLSNDCLMIESQDQKGRSYHTIASLDRLKSRKIYESLISISGEENKTKLLLTKKLANAKTLVVYTQENQINYYLYPDSQRTPYEPLIRVRALALWPKILGKKFRIFYVAYIINPYAVPIDKQSLYIDDANQQEIQLQQTNSITPKAQLLRRHLYFASFKTRELLKGEDVPINAGLKIKLIVNGQELSHPISVRDRKLENHLLYYLPKSLVRVGNYFAYLRSNGSRSLILVRRPVEDIEQAFQFRFLESCLISFAMFYLAKIAKKLSKVRVNLYYEKNAEKSDEGAFEVFKKSQQIGNRSRNYFILWKESPDYNRIGNDECVVAKYSLKYYWLTYRSNYLIATESPSHLNIIRTNNRYLRRALYEKGFIFLQHGIIYMKNLGKTSTFSAGKDAEPKYMIVSSKKERNVVSRTLKLPEEKLLSVGLPSFDTISYRHIRQSSPNIVTVMLTWKPYEEHVSDFTKTSYYINTVALAKLLNSFIPSENIRLVAHPKVAKPLKATGLANVWEGNIPEAFADCKLAITDYSSICYYAFYQGAAVIFYQPDLDVYQEHIGQLIPEDHEYVGERVFDVAKLRDVLKNSVEGGEIDLSKLRSDKFLKRYQTINEFHDGKNTDRLCKSLKQLGII
jgi:glycosyltransferase involved in cell wall biosynthesis